jgi:polyphenol oxidase
MAVWEDGLAKCVWLNWLDPQTRDVDFMNHRMTIRQGGTSHPPFDSFNLGDHVGDALDAVATNRQLLQKQLGVRPVFLKQIHGTRCIQIDADTPDGLEADAVVTTDPSVACTIMVADCLPVLLWNESGSAVGAAHAGWRGFVGLDGVDVLQATVAALRGLSMHGEPLHAWLGACIGFDYFEVGSEVALHFDAAFKRPVPGNHSQDKWLVDLAGAARQRLLDWGAVSVDGNNGLSPWCTVQNEAEYFSHRRDAKKWGSTGRMAACIWRS